MTPSAGEGPRVLVSVKDGVATFTLNRPGRLNALDHGPGSFQRELVDALVHADDDDEVRCSIITGAGRAFSSGGDLGAVGAPKRSSDWYSFLHAEDEDNERIRQLKKPTIGAINGMCFGAALIMAAHFDILVASDVARLGLIETRFGGTGVDVLAYHIGPQWAKFLALSGELLTAERAQAIGLVLAVVPHENLAERAADLGRRIASMPPAAAVMNRRVVNGAMDHMGWGSQKQLALALNSIASSETPHARAANGRLFSELREEGWEAYKAARDEPFRTPWLNE